MRHFVDYRLEDFVTDDQFCEWVNNPTESSNAFWREWLKNNPSKESLVEEAKATILKLHDSTSTPITKEVISNTWDDIMSSIEPHHNPIFGKVKRWLIAASVVIGLSIPSYHLFVTEDKSEELVTLNENSKWIEYTNSTDAIWRVELKDGSTVVLEPDSYLKYPISFTGKTRSVILKGEAFFDIARDTIKPFYVYANDAVIRVLGTSFFVKAKELDKDIEVIVKTGKVAVYKRKDIVELKKIKTSELKPLVVTPNQKVVFNKADQSMTRRLTSTPSLIKPLRTLKKLYFDAAPVSEIFQALEEAYGVQISIYEGAKVDCRLSTTLTEETLYEKLEIVCHPLGLTYYERDGKIIIDGSCQ